MKNSKRIASLLLAALVSTSAVPAFADDAETTEENYGIELISLDEDSVAEDGTAPSASENVSSVDVKTANLGEVIADEENWVANSTNEITFEKNKIVNNNESTAYFAYKQNNYADTMIQYKQTFDFENGWGGFVLNSSSYSAAIWSGGQGYLVVIKEAQIELQRWGKSGQEFLVVMKNDCIKDKTAANISAGAINVNGGINIFMFVDGKCVINYFDTADDMVKEGTYFTLYETAGSSIEAYDGGELPAVPAALKLSGRANEGAEYKAEFITASFGAESNEKYTYEWFFTSEKMDKLNEYALSKEEPVKKSVGTGETHKVASGEIGGYYTVTVKNEKGESVLNGVPVIVNNYDYVVSSSIVLHIDCEYALVNGTKFQIDPDDYNVAPAIADSRTLVPVRFIAESLGADVEWENDTKKITVSLGGKQIVMTLNEKSYSVDGREFELDVPAQVMYERTMVPVRVVSEAFGKNVFWDAENELIVISDEDLGIDSETESATLSYVLSRIIKRI